MITLDQGLKRDDVHPVMTDRKFGITLAVLFTFLALWPTIFSRPPRSILLWLGSGLAVTAIAVPVALHWPRIVWMAITTRIAKVVSFVLLGVIFYGVVTPVALLFRLIGRDALHRRLDAGAATYWIARGSAPGNMRQQF